MSIPYLIAPPQRQMPSVLSMFLNISWFFRFIDTNCYHPKIEYMVLVLLTIHLECALWVPRPVSSTETFSSPILLPFWDNSAFYINVILLTVTLLSDGLCGNCVSFLVKWFNFSVEHHCFMFMYQSLMQLPLLQQNWKSPLKLLQHTAYFLSFIFVFGSCLHPH